MAETTKKSARRAAKRLERQRRRALSPPRPSRVTGPGHMTLPPPDRPDDTEGGAGVREPRRPLPTMPAGAMELAEPDDSPAYFDLSEPRRAAAV